MPPSNRSNEQLLNEAALAELTNPKNPSAQNFMAALKEIEVNDPYVIDENAFSVGHYRPATNTFTVNVDANKDGFDADFYKLITRELVRLHPKGTDIDKKFRVGHRNNEQWRFQIPPNAFKDAIFHYAREKGLIAEGEKPLNLVHEVYVSPQLVQKLVVVGELTGEINFKKTAKHCKKAIQAICEAVGGKETVNLALRYDDDDHMRKFAKRDQLANEQRFTCTMPAELEKRLQEISPILANKFTLDLRDNANVLLLANAINEYVASAKRTEKPAIISLINSKLAEQRTR